MPFFGKSGMPGPDMGKGGMPGPDMGKGGMPGLDMGKGGMPGFFLQEREAGSVPAGRMPFPSKQAVHVPAQAEQLLGQQASASHHAPAPEAPSIFGTLPRGSIDQRAAQIQMHGNDHPFQQKGHSLFSGIAASHQQQAAPERGAPVGFNPAQFQHELQVAPQLGRPFGSSMMQQGPRAPPVQNGGGIGGLARRPAKLQILHARLDEVYASIAASGFPDLEEAFFQGLCKRFDKFSQFQAEHPDLARLHQGPRGMAIPFGESNRHRHSSQTPPQKKARQDAGPSIQELRDAYLANAHLGNRPMSERLPRHAEDKRLPLTRDADDGPNRLTEKRKAMEVKKKKDPNAPKMPNGGGYGCFFEENFAKIKATLPAGHKTTDVSKAAGPQWKALSDEIKKPYAAMYQKKMDLYKVAMEEYKKTKPGSVKEEDNEEAEDEATVPGASASSSGLSSRKRGRADGQNFAMPVAAPSAGDASAPVVAPAAAPAAADGMIGDASAFAVPRSPGIWNLREHMFKKSGAAAASAAAAGMTGEGADDQHAAMPGDASAPAVAPAAAEEPGPAEEPAPAVAPAPASAAAEGMIGEGADDQHAAMPGDAQEGSDFELPDYESTCSQENASAPAVAPAPAPASAAAAGMIPEGADDQHAAIPGEVAVPAASSAGAPDMSDGEVAMPAEESDQ